MFRLPASARQALPRPRPCPTNSGAAMHCPARHEQHGHQHAPGCHPNCHCTCCTVAQSHSLPYLPTAGSMSDGALNRFALGSIHPNLSTRLGPRCIFPVVVPHGSGYESTTVQASPLPTPSLSCIPTKRPCWRLPSVPAPLLL